MKNGYRRRADAIDMRFEFTLSLAEWELGNVAETDEERAMLQQEIDRLKVVIEEQRPKPLPDGVSMATHPYHPAFHNGPMDKMPVGR